MFKVTITIFFFLMCIKQIHAQDDIIYLHYQDKPPYYNINRVSKQVEGGELYVIIKKIMSEAKIPYELQNVPTARSILEIKNNLDKVCITYAYINKERESYSHFLRPYYKDKKVALAIRKKDKRFIKYKTFASIIKDPALIPITRIGYSFGDYINKLLLEYKDYNSVNIEKIDLKKIKATSLEAEGMLEAVANEEADFSYLPLNEIEYHIKNNSKIGKLLTIKTVDDIKEGQFRYFMCSKAIHVKTIEKINNAIIKVMKKENTK